MVKFNERLKLLRNESELSQADFAKIIGISKSSINMYERGEREPGLEVLENIADYFNVDMDFLLGKSDVRNKNKLISSPYQLQVDKTVLVLTDDETKLLSIYRTLSDQGKEYILQTLDMAAQVYIKSDSVSNMETDIV